MAHIKKIKLDVDYGTGALQMEADKRPEHPLEAKIWDLLNEALDPHKLIKLQQEFMEGKK